MNKKYILLAIIIYAIFPISSVLMKYASININIVIKISLFCASIGVLGIFSILWQKLLKNVDLVKAYVFKSTTVIWSAIYGVLLFEEKISINMILGLGITTLGIIITILGDAVNE